MNTTEELATSKIEKVLGLLSVNRCVTLNSKLCHWHLGRDETEDTFYNQALNSLYNYGAKTIRSLKSNWSFKKNSFSVKGLINIKPQDARSINNSLSIHITDPPYADAVNYHELSEFFLVWDKKFLLDLFPEWYIDSKRVLAVQGKGIEFNQSMIEIYKNLSNHMYNNGIQVVLFTHQDVNVWAELALIFWSAGLRVTAAWNISTETEAVGIKKGNYVKSTVVLILRKQDSEEKAYLTDLYPEIEQEVCNQIDSMKEIDDEGEPNFTDPDYLLAAYAASLKVLTSYKHIEGIDIEYELSKSRKEESPIVKIINEAWKIAQTYLIPQGIDSFIWKTLSPEERFFIKGLDLEKKGINTLSAFQELARGFGVKGYDQLLEIAKANHARLKTTQDLSKKSTNEGFENTLLRHVLNSIYQSIREDNIQSGKSWLRNQVPNYWEKRTAIVEILMYIATLSNNDNMKHWAPESEYSCVLTELIKNDGV